MSRRTFLILKALLIFGLSNILFTSFWMLHTFSRVSLSQTATLLALDLGAADVPGNVARSYFFWALIIPAAITACVCVSGYCETRGKKLASLAVLCILLPAALAFSLKVNFDFFGQDSRLAPVADNIYDHYRPPILPASPKGKPLNVIWIFVESLEKQYEDPAMNAELDQATSFMTPLTVSPLLNLFTVGGVMSAKCGAPIYFTPTLVLSFHDAGFNNATCFDDVLRKNGYSSYFVVGHDASLSGFRNYYEKHASAQIEDAKYMDALHFAKGGPYDTYSDEKVFETALGVLQSQGLKQPFSLNILTLDNHAPDGFPSDTCKSRYGSDMDAVIRCDNHSLAQFIQEIKQMDILQNTVLVVMGDHPFAGTFDQLSTARNIFTKIYTPLPDKKVLNVHPSPFDFFPSVLSAMGFGVGQQRYAFGYSFYDVAAYPLRDWKGRLASFPSASPTAAYKALNR